MEHLYFLECNQIDVVKVMGHGRMKHSGIGRYLAIVVLSFLCVPFSSAQELTFAEAKAHYVIEITKHITWPNEGRFDTFRVGVIGHDEDLMAAFAQKTSAEVRGKTFSFERIDPYSLPGNYYPVIFITKKSRSKNALVYSKVKNTLVISDGNIERDAQMVSLIPSLRKVKIKLNRDNLAHHGFDVSINLLELAGTKEDLGEQLREKEARLNALLAQVKKKEKSLGKLNEKLSKNTTLLASANDQLAEREVLLSSNKLALGLLSKNIDESQAEVMKNRDDIARQKQLITDKQKELSLQETVMVSLAEEIDRSRTILDEQSSEIKHQGGVIETKEQTIVEQRGWLGFVLIVTVVFFVMIYFLMRVNHLRKKTNKELERLNGQLYELATTDGMTHLFNRRHFLESSENEFIRQQRKQSQSIMLMMDIDHFKKVNDTFGHAAGDEAIKLVADILKKSLRQYDIVGRIGGEEYAMMLVDCDIDLAAKIGLRLCQEIEGKDIHHDGDVINITISIGLSRLGDDDTNVEQSLARADKALYDAKQGGRNQVVVFSMGSDTIEN